VAGVTLPDMRPWGRSPLTIPPKSTSAWLQLVVWEVWMGILLAITLGFGLFLIATARTHIITLTDLSACYGAPPIPLPCDHIRYRGGALDAAFTALCGMMLVGVALWSVWELWVAVEPRPVTDDFLRLLNDSFGRDWRNPLKWPWAHVLWAYGFTAVGAALTAVIGFNLWMVLASTPHPKRPAARVDTSQSYRLGR